MENGEQRIRANAERERLPVLMMRCYFQEERTRVCRISISISLRVAHAVIHLYCLALFSARFAAKILQLERLL
jgi:hypothetical protein